jgi:hypothetical protein
MRLQEILTWGEITTARNPSPQALSFQSGFMRTLSVCILDHFLTDSELTLQQLFTCKAVIASTMRGRAK